MLIGPGQFQVTRGNQLLFDLVDLRDAAEIKADVQVKRVRLIKHGADLVRIGVEDITNQLLKITAGLRLHGTNPNTECHQNRQSPNNRTTHRYACRIDGSNVRYESGSFIRKKET